MDAFITGDLPPVDVLDGTDASNQLQFIARPPSGFGLLLLLLGVIPYLIWSYTRDAPVTGILPISERTLRIFRRLDGRRTTRMTAAAGVVAAGVVLSLIGTLVFDAPEVVAPGVVLAVVGMLALLWFSTPPLPIRIDVERGARSVVLNAHPAFRDAFVGRGTRSTSRSVSPVDELERLAILRAEGAITSEEFEAAKRQVLGTTTRDVAM